MKKRILLIEDEIFLRELYKRELELENLLTDAFEKGKEGLQALQENHYDLVLLDIMLPDMNGIDVLKQIKQNPATKDVPVAFLTNLGQDSITKEGYELGAIGYLLKSSYTPDQIVAEVKKLLEKN